MIEELNKIIKQNIKNPREMKINKIFETLTKCLTSGKYKGNLNSYKTYANVLSRLVEKTRNPAGDGS